MNQLINRCRGFMRKYVSFFVGLNIFEDAFKVRISIFDAARFIFFKEIIHLSPEIWIGHILLNAECAASCINSEIQFNTAG